MLQHDFPVNENSSVEGYTGSWAEKFERAGGINRRGDIAHSVDTGWWHYTAFWRRAPCED